MVEEQHVALVRRAVAELWNGQELAVADVVFGPDYINHNGVIPDLVRGPEAIKVSVALYRLAFPDLHITVDEVYAAGDRVHLRWTAERRRGAPPDDRARAAVEPAGPRFTGRMVIRFAGGQIVESWTEWDQGAVLEQLGLIPPTSVASRSSVDLGRRRRRPV